MTGPRRVLQTLRAHYAKDGVPHTMNEVQITNYLDELRRFDDAALEAAAKQWTRQSRFFPALSELLDLLEPRLDAKSQAALAWSEVERLTRKVSSYRDVQFNDPVLGEAVRRVFGSWSRAVMMDQDDPMWASRRNAFVSIYPALLASPLPPGPVLLRGHHGGPPYVVASTRPAALAEPDKSPEVFAAVRQRFLVDRG